MLIFLQNNTGKMLNINTGYSQHGPCIIMNLKICVQLKENIGFSLSQK